jgi:hypothetical protein
MLFFSPHLAENGFLLVLLFLKKKYWKGFEEIVLQALNRKSIFVKNKKTKREKAYPVTQQKLHLKCSARQQDPFPRSGNLFQMQISPQAAEHSGMN